MFNTKVEVTDNTSLIFTMTLSTLYHRNSLQATTEPVTGFGQFSLSLIIHIDNTLPNYSASSLTLGAFVTNVLFNYNLWL